MTREPELQIEVESLTEDLTGEWQKMSPDEKEQANSAASQLGTLVREADDAYDVFEPAIEAIMDQLETLGPCQHGAAVESFYNHSITFLANAKATEAINFLKRVNSSHPSALVRQTAGRAISALQNKSVPVDDLSGIALVPSGEELWHVIPKDTLKAQGGALRIPGVSYDTACGKEVMPVSARVIFETFQEATHDRFDYCQECIITVKNSS